MLFNVVHFLLGDLSVTLADSARNGTEQLQSCMSLWFLGSGHLWHGGKVSSAALKLVAGSFASVL